jgi:endonuclease YncB( thermonuclease family)
MPAILPWLLGGILGWNLLTDWVWISKFLHLLPTNYQEDLQKRTISIIGLINAARGIVIGASRERRKLTPEEVALIKQNCDLAEKEINELDGIYRKKAILFGAQDIAAEVERTKAILFLQLEDLRRVAGITVGPEVKIEEVTAKVVAVFDGDTLALDNGEHVRLVGIDAPEGTTEAGYASKVFLASLILGKTVKVRSDPKVLTDIYGRRLGVVFVNTLNVNTEMLRRAYADFYLIEPNVLVATKEWEAIAKEGKEIFISEPLAALRDAKDYSVSLLRLWKAEELARVSLEIEAELERLKSEAREKLELLKDEYAVAKEELRDTLSAKIAEVRDLVRAETISREEGRKRISNLRAEAREKKRLLREDYRTKKAAISDPHRATRAKLKKEKREKQKEVRKTYVEKYREIIKSYRENIALIKKRKGLVTVAEPVTPTTIGPETFKLPPVEEMEKNVPEIKIVPPEVPPVVPEVPEVPVKVTSEIKKGLSEIVDLQHQVEKVKDEAKKEVFKAKQEAVSSIADKVKETAASVAKEVTEPKGIVSKIIESGKRIVKALKQFITRDVEGRLTDLKKEKEEEMAKWKKEYDEMVKTYAKLYKEAEAKPPEIAAKEKKEIMSKMTKEIEEAKKEKDLIEKHYAQAEARWKDWGKTKEEKAREEVTKRVAKEAVSPALKVGEAVTKAIKKVGEVKAEAVKKFEEVKTTVLTTAAKKIAEIQEKAKGIKAKLTKLIARKK